MRTARIGAVALLLTFLPAVAVAQNHHPGAGDKQDGGGMGGMMQMMQMHSGRMMMGRGGAGMAGMGMMMTYPMTGPGPAMILRHRQSLSLDESQVEQLEGLEKKLAEARETRAKEMQSLQAQFAELRSADELDLGKYEALLEQIAENRVAAQVETARVGQEALGVLTEEQRGKLRTGMQMMHEGGMMGGMRGGPTMGGCPMKPAGASEPFGKAS